jgi:hypothetical protein
MNIVGNKDLFAIQWEIESKEGNYLYGKLCFWAEGIQIGDFEEMTTVSISASYLRDFLANKGMREFSGSDFMNSENLYYCLYQKYFSGVTIKDGTFSELSKIRDVFWLDDVGEYSFRDKIGIILVDEKKLNRQRLVWERFKDGIIQQAIFPIGYFDKIAMEFLEEFESSKKRLYSN